MSALMNKYNKEQEMKQYLAVVQGMTELSED